MSQRNLSPVAQIAKKIRQDLKAQFPGHKFSVTSKSYSMGSSIYISWTDGPTAAAVELITDPYRNVRYCEYSQEILSGGNRYVNTKRYYSPERFVPIARHICETDALWSDIDFEQLIIEVTEEGASIGNNPTLVQNRNWYSLNTMTREQLSAISFYAPPVQARPASPVTPDPSSAVTITENSAKDGIEIRFTDKPTAETRQALKDNGFRWSRSNGLWYAKRSPEALSFAHQLRPSIAAPTPPEPVLSLPAPTTITFAVSDQLPLDPCPQPLPSVSAVSYQVITQPPPLTPIVFLTPRQRLKQQLDRLDIDQLLPDQVEALLAVLG